MLRIAKLAPFAVAALIAGCGSSNTTSTAPATASSSAAPAGSGSQLSLTETEFKIAPASPTVAKTGTVTITVQNHGKVTHALAVQTPSGVVRTGPIAAGATATLKVDVSKAGSYTFYCPIGGHRMLGMKGTLVVGAGAGASGGAAASTTSSASRGSGY